MKFNFINGNRRYTRVRSLFARTQCVQISAGQRNTYYPRLSAGLAYIRWLCPPPIAIAPTIEITRPRSRMPVRLLHRSIITYARQLGNGRRERERGEKERGGEGGGEGETRPRSIVASNESNGERHDRRDVSGIFILGATRATEKARAVSVFLTPTTHANLIKRIKAGARPCVLSNEPNSFTFERARGSYRLL